MAPAVTEPADEASTKDIYNRLADDWNAHLKNAEAASEPHYHTDGYLGLIERARKLSDSPELSENTRRGLARVLDAHEKQMAEQAAFAEDDDLNTLDAQTSRETLSPSIEGPRRQETVETVPAAETVSKAETPRKAAAVAEPAGEASTNDLYNRLADDWNAHLKNAEASGRSHYYTDGYIALIERARTQRPPGTVGKYPSRPRQGARRARKANGRTSGVRQGNIARARSAADRGNLERRAQA